MGFGLLLGFIGLQGLKGGREVAGQGIAEQIRLLLDGKGLIGAQCLIWLFFVLHRSDLADSSSTLDKMHDILLGIKQTLR